MYFNMDHEEEFEQIYWCCSCKSIIHEKEITCFTARCGSKILRCPCGSEDIHCIGDNLHNGQEEL